MASGRELVPVKPDEGERFGDFIQRLIIGYPKYSSQFRVSPGHTDGTGRSSVALLVPSDVADDLLLPKPDDDLISEDEEVPPQRVVASETEIAAPVVELRPVEADDTFAQSPPVTRGRRRKSSATS